MEVKEKTGKVNLICLVLMLTIIGGIWVPPLMFVAFAINAVATVMLKSKESFYILLFIMPFGLIYKYPGVTLSFLTLIEIVMAFVILFRYKKIKSSLLFLLTFITLYFILRMNTYYMAIPKLIVSYLIVAVFIKSYDKDSVSRYIDYFILGLILSSVLGIFKESIPSLLSYYSDMNYDYIDGERTLRFSGLFNDPNYFSIALIAAMVMLIFLKKYKNYPIGRFYLFFTALSVLGLLTYSKSFILMYAVVLVLEVAFNLKSQHKLQSFAEILLIAVLFAIVFLGKIEIINKIFSRFTNSQGLTTGRSDIWEKYWKVIESKEIYKWFGLGLDAPYVAEKAAHNLYIEMIYYSGYVGLILFLISWIGIVFSSHKNRIRPGNMLLFAIVLIMYAFLSGFLNYAFPFYMIFCWMIADINFKEKYYESYT
ncbi:MAG: O-antigen ligase family protein [Eubacteriales bacterium]